jgi:hypothetical protein
MRSATGKASNNIDVPTGLPVSSMPGVVEPVMRLQVASAYVSDSPRVQVHANRVGPEFGGNI